MDSVITWLVRSLHVLGAAVWIGGYAVLALVIVPALAQAADASTRRLALMTIRVLSIAGTLTIIVGLVLVARSRGYAALLTGGEWGLNVISAAVLSIVLMGIGDAALRPAVQRLGAGDTGGTTAARRWALAGLAISVLALLVMTRALYAST